MLSTGIPLMEKTRRIAGIWLTSISVRETTLPGSDVVTHHATCLPLRLSLISQAIRLALQAAALRS